MKGAVSDLKKNKEMFFGIGDAAKRLELGEGGDSVFGGTGDELATSLARKKGALNPANYLKN